MSSYSADAAEQVVRMTLEGSEVAIKLAGSGASNWQYFFTQYLGIRKRPKERRALPICSGAEKSLRCLQ